MEAKLWSVFSARIAMRSNSLSLPKKFSMGCRHFYTIADGARLPARMLGDDDFGATPSSSAMMALLSTALSESNAIAR